jgi:hypothetical protein
VVCALGRHEEVCVLLQGGASTSVSTVARSGAVRELGGHNKERGDFPKKIAVDKIIFSRTRSSAAFTACSTSRILHSRDEERLLGGMVITTKRRDFTIGEGDPATLM